MKQITCPHCGDTYPDFDVAHVCSKGPYAPQLKSKMNERIRELAHKAGLPTYNPDGIPTKLEKFAELIVRECFVKLTPYLDDQFIDDIESELKEHFGVEE